MPSEVSSASPDGLTFEQAFGYLEETVRKLESGDLTIEEMVNCYEQGLRLAEFCNRRLDAAELKISQLAKAADGSLSLDEFPRDPL